MSLKQLRPDGPIFFIFMQLSAKNMPNNRLAPLPGLEPLPLEVGNPGYVTDLIICYVLMTQF